MNTATIIIGFVLVASVWGGHHDHGPANYKFEYGVEDHHTGDIKSQHEHRHGKELDGGYTLKEADGTTRIVKYHSDHKGGFDAIVERIGHAKHPGHKHAPGGTSYVGVTHYGYKH